MPNMFEANVNFHAHKAAYAWTTYLMTGIF